VAPLQMVGSEPAAREEVQPRRPTRLGCRGTAPGGGHGTSRNGRVLRASHSDEWGKVALAPTWMPRAGKCLACGPGCEGVEVANKWTPLKEFPDLNRAPNQILAGKTNSQVERKNPGKSWR
jgi:hypothetical protein